MRKLFSKVLRAYRRPAAHRSTASTRSERAPGPRRPLRLLAALAFVAAAVVGVGGLASAKSTTTCSGGVAEKALCIARKQKGDPYVWGGKGAGSFDCSGLTYYAYRKAGLNWKYRVADDQYRYGVDHGRAVSTKNLAPGDLIFFNWDGGEIDHVGIYAGNNRMVHASSSRGKVVETTLNSYYRSHMLGKGVRLSASAPKQPNGGTSKPKTTEPKPKKTTKPTKKPDPEPTLVEIYSYSLA
ncbi:C40 family peptidase [Micromonospora sp. NPDC049559]|uniref:C40 family peptidase n=1 Tax=Micromonospora sp. NPDC049559 TaxID=3155923 RepID=UPI003425A2DB